MARDRFGSVDILVNCAGIGGGAPFTELSVGDWDRMIAVHLRGAFLVSRIFFAGMVAHRWGRIINIASQLAFKGGPMLAHYCAAKAGVVGFTKALAHEGAPHGVLVNAVAPGPVETELLNEMSREWRDANAGICRWAASGNRTKSLRRSSCWLRTQALFTLARRFPPTAET